MSDCLVTLLKTGVLNVSTFKHSLNEFSETKLHNVQELQTFMNCLFLVHLVTGIAKQRDECPFKNKPNINITRN